MHFHPQSKLKLKVSSDRKARTRTLIQMGGLLNVLAYLEGSLPTTLSDQVIDQFKQLGIRVIKKYAAQKIKA